LELSFHRSHNGLGFDARVQGGLDLEHARLLISVERGRNFAEERYQLGVAPEAHRYVDRFADERRGAVRR
jgi:hypothetical protein